MYGCRVCDYDTCGACIDPTSRRPPKVRICGCGMHNDTNLSVHHCVGCFAPLQNIRAEVATGGGASAASTSSPLSPAASGGSGGGSGGGGDGEGKTEGKAEGKDDGKDVGKVKAMDAGRLDDRLKAMDWRARLQLSRRIPFQRPSKQDRCRRFVAAMGQFTVASDAVIMEMISSLAGGAAGRHRAQWDNPCSSVQPHEVATLFRNSNPTLYPRLRHAATAASEAARAVVVVGGGGVRYCLGRRQQCDRAFDWDMFDVVQSRVAYILLLNERVRSVLPLVDFAQVRKEGEYS